MRSDVFKLIRKLALFASPLVLFAGFIMIVDPYDFSPLPSPVPEELKRDISYKTNYAMWKMFEYRSAPKPSILLGDSRMMSLDTDVIREEAGLDFYNFAYGGGSLREAIDTFWFATRQTTLERASFGINLNLFNDNDRKNRVAEVEACLRNPLLYVVNRNVVAAAGRLVIAATSDRAPQLGKPRNREEFWHRQLDVTTRGYYANYRYPTSYLAELAEVAAHCRVHGIDLSFVIFPSHRDLQDQVARYGLEQAERDMVHDLARLGRVYDFELRNDLTADADNFRDPYHFNDEVMRDVIRGIWAGDRRFVKVHGPATAEGPVDK